MSLPPAIERRLLTALALAFAATIAQAQTAQQLEERRLQYNEEKRREVGTDAPGVASRSCDASSPARQPARRRRLRSHLVLKDLAGQGMLAEAYAAAPSPSR